MRPWRWLFAAGLVASAAEPPMPQWREGDRKASGEGALVPGSGLLAADEENQATAIASVPLPLEVGIGGPEAAPPEVAERYLNHYFGARPTSFLTDPQGLLGEKEKRDREEFLEYHSGDSEIDLFVFLFGEDEVIPSEVREEEAIERFFLTGKPAVIVYYHFGAPERSLIHISPALGDAVSAAERRRALDSSIEEAMEKSDHAGQLEAFCVQLSIRIYWMERAAGWVRTGPAVLAARRPNTREAPARTVMPEARAEAWLQEFGAPAAAVTGALLIVAIGAGVARHRARYRLPVFDVPPRLGGPHAAGIGAVISFGSTTQSPSSQRNGVPDHLGL